MFVKVCGITSEEDALLAVAMGADALGFDFTPSERRIAPERAGDIAKRLPPEVLTVGVFRDEARTRVVEAANVHGLKAVQLEGRESADDTKWIRERVPCVIRTLAPKGSATLKRNLSGTDAVLINAAPADATDVFDWRLAEIPHTSRLILGGTLTLQNVSNAVAQVRPWGINLLDGAESSTGHKDAKKLRGLIELARSAAPAKYRSEDEAPYDWQEEDAFRGR